MNVVFVILNLKLQIFKLQQLWMLLVYVHDSLLTLWRRVIVVSIHLTAHEPLTIYQGNISLRFSRNSEEDANSSSRLYIGKGLVIDSSFNTLSVFSIECFRIIRIWYQNMVRCICTASLYKWIITVYVVTCCVVFHVPIQDKPLSVIYVL